MESEGNYANGAKAGQWKYYYVNGQMYSVYGY
jgi:antitoxin component YwqK of YwqJK toxin-antitoxin module